MTRFPLIALSCTALLAAPQVFAQAGNNGTCTCSPEQTSKAFTAVAKKSTPAVLFLKVESSIPDQEPSPYSYQSPYDSFGDDFFNRFFGSPYRGGQPQKPAPQMSQGSGFFVSADGYALTNAHVVKGADKITAVLNDGREMDATVVGIDTQTDIAVVKVEGKDFPFLTLGNSDEIDIGEWVIAIGSPFQLEASVTVGIISAKGRQNLRITDFEDFIQTDAAINPGNSGGPLLDLQGNVIGINTAIVSRSGGYMGIGFAIPSIMAKNIMDQIIASGSVTRGFLGVSLQPVDKDIADAFNLPRPEGALVSEVVKDSPAEKAGLKQGDIILEYNKNSIKSLQTFRNEISLMNPGSTITLKVNRKGEILTITATLGTASGQAGAAGSLIQKLGMEIDNLTPDLAKQLGYTQKEEGVVITKIKPGSAAALGGLRPGFLIQAVNHKKVTTVEEFNEALGQAENKRILLLVRQGNATRFYSIKLE
ncbi:MAG: DegQ family serine endoprotease [Verrucomicrobia bacterium]|nr:DegQ family serine endoprotease [Verrucomicrobiota bacterium]